MALLISALMFLFVASVSYLLGMRFWVSPQNMLERVIGEGRRATSWHRIRGDRDSHFTRRWRPCTQDLDQRRASGNAQDQS